MKKSSSCKEKDEEKIRWPVENKVREGQRDLLFILSFPWRGASPWPSHLSLYRPGSKSHEESNPADDKLNVMAMGLRFTLWPGLSLLSLSGP